MVATAVGDPSVLRFEQRPDPAPGERQVLVEVSHAGVNFADVVMRRGGARVQPPLVLGVEGAGVVREVGKGVSELRAGDRVAWTPTLLASSIGSYAELAVVGADQAVPVPDDVTLELAAATLLQGVTAHYLVHDIHPVGRGTRVLVHAAAGGTGRTVVQWLRHLGAEVLATVGTEEKAAVAREAGADHVIRYRDVDVVDAVRDLTDGAGVAYVVDGVGGPDFRRNLKVLADGGCVCVFGQAGGVPEPFSPIELAARGLTVRGAMSSQFLRSREETVAKANEVWAGVREGWLRPLVHDVLPLGDAATAHRRLEGRETVGKLVLAVARDAAEQAASGRGW